MQNVNTNFVIVARVAAFVLALGIIGYMIWKMPLVELFYLFLFVFMVPTVFLGAVGLVSAETVLLCMAGAGKFRAMVEEKMAEMKAE